MLSGQPDPRRGATLEVGWARGSFRAVGPWPAEPGSPHGSMEVEVGSWGWRPSLASIAKPPAGDE
eukprot:12328879-Alexandrium_andersonii.AAC.1